MSIESILNNWKLKVFKPVNWLEGEEDYYINQLMQYAENNILTEAEASFNLVIFYGKDANWADVVNACCRYPMFADKQVVLLKEAQHMKDIEKLENYILQPLASTIFVISYKEKKFDRRNRFGKLIKESKNIDLVSTKKIYDNQLPEWTSELVRSKGYSISQKAQALLVENIGNDLNRINNEIEKLAINLGERKNITEDDIERFIGISKEYNVFELQDAFGKRDLSRAIRIIQHFESNPKAYPIQLILPSIYQFFSKCFMAFGALETDEKGIAIAIGVNPYFVKDYLVAIKKYSFEGVERALLLLHEYNLKSVGINDHGTSDGSLLKELAVKIIL
ncbi:MAG: DNA polymerase III subunit delta [Chitinophagaceae bacterium]